MPKVKLSGFIIVPEGDLDVVLSELPNHIDLTRNEPGCISFQVRQSETDPHRFDVNETFESRAAFELHQARVRTSRWGAVTSNVARHYEIEEEQPD